MDPSCDYYHLLTPKQIKRAEDDPLYLMMLDIKYIFIDLGGFQILALAGISMLSLVIMFLALV